MKRTFSLSVLIATIPTWGALGCDALVHNEEFFQSFACSVIPYYAADCSDPEVQARVRSVLVDGAVQAELDCTGIALGAPGKSVAVKHYKASRLQDGACNAKVDLFAGLPPTPGLSQASASELTARSTPERPTDADLCPVSAFSVAGVRFTTWVEGGVIQVEGPGCTTTPGTTCSLPLTSPFASCTGDLDAF